MHQRALTRADLDPRAAVADIPDDGYDIIRRRADGTVPSIEERFGTLPSGPIKLPNPIDPNSRGGRLFQVRMMAGVSRKTVEAMARLTTGHLGRLEYGQKRLNNTDTIYKLIAAFFNLGVSIDMHWLMLGPERGGEPPELNERFWKRYPERRPRAVVLSEVAGPPALPPKPVVE